MFNLLTATGRVAGAARRWLEEVSVQMKISSTLNAGPASSTHITSFQF